MLETCPHCQSQVLYVNETCPRCGKPRTQPPPVPPRQTPQQPQSSSQQVESVAPVFAGVLLIFAGLASIAVGSADPSNPSPSALLVCASAILGGVLSITGRRTPALICATLVLVATGLFALVALNRSGGGPIPELSLLAALIHGGAGFLLALWARWNLRAKDMWMGSSPVLPRPSPAPQSQAIPASQPAVSEILQGSRYTVSVYGRYCELEENAVVTASQGDGTSIRVVLARDEASTVSSLSSDSLASFKCPWCSRQYLLKVARRNLVFRCVACNKQVLACVTEKQ